MRATWLAVPVFVGVASLAVPSPASAEPAPPAGSAVQQFGACMSARKTGDLLLLIDRSGSLARTDPRGVRATAASYLLDQLASTTQAWGTTLNVAVSGFDVGYDNVVGWTKLDESALPALRRSVEGFRNRDSGVDTDYVAALEGAQREFRGRSTDGQPGCHAVLWFTDGKFDLEQRRNPRMLREYGAEKPYAPGVRLDDAAGVKRAVEAGRTALCRPGGIADQVRASGILTFAEGLGVSGSADSDFAFLRALATGATASGRCGNTPQSTVGEFHLASDIDDLLYAFDAVGDLRQTPTLTTAGVCARTACAAGSRSFVLDSSIRSVHLLAGANAGGMQVVVRAPSGVSVTISNPTPAAPPTLGGGQVTSRWLSERTLDLSIRRGHAAGWSGPWSVAVVDPSGTRTGARSRIQLRITSDLAPAVVGDDQLDLHAGDTPAIRLGLVSETTRQPVSAVDLPGDVSVAAEFRPTGAAARAVTATPVAKADLGRPINLDLKDVPLGSAVLRLTLRERTADTRAVEGHAAVRGTQLADRVVDVPLRVLPPLNFPRVSEHLTFQGGEGVGPFPAALTVTGPGCVWVDGATATVAPDGVGSASVKAESANGPQSCVTVAAGVTAKLAVRLTLRHPGNGTVAGTLTAHLAPTGAPQRALSMSVPFLADVVKPTVESVRDWLLIAALLLGLGLPALFLYGAKWWTARIPGQPLLAGAVPATLTGGGVVRDGRPFTVDHDDVTFLPVDSGGTRQLRLPGSGLILKTRMGWRPTAPGYTTVSAPGRTAVVDRLPLAVHNSWVAVLDDPAADRIDVQILLPGGANAATYDRLSQQIRTELPRLVEAARRRAATSTKAAPADTGEVNATAAGGDWFGGAPPSSASAPDSDAPGRKSGDGWW